MTARIIALLAMGLAATFAVAQTPELEAEKKRLVALEKTYTSAKSAHEKAPKDARLRKARVNATAALGTAIMNTPTQPPRQKYPRALRLYREALALDPKNKEATEGKAMIEGIYRSMGRPIPD